MNETRCVVFTSAESYDRFMGRFSVPLAREFVALVVADPDLRALDVGCGPGAVTAELVERLGADQVVAVDPSEPFVEAARSRLPGVDVRVAAAEDLPFADDAFDLAVAGLVAHFLTDPVAALAELARVTRPGGRVAATVWDFAGGRGPLGAFERAAHDLDPAAPTDAALPAAAEGQLVEFAERAGLVDIRPGELTVSVAFDTFDEWWEPFTLGVGPAGAYVASLDAGSRERLRRHALELVGEVPFTIDATAWVVVASVAADPSARASSV